jgi:hypothetical protein
MLHKDGSFMRYEEHNKHPPHGLIYESLYTLRERLREFKRAGEGVYQLTRGTRYHFWHGLGFYSLLGEEGLEMLEAACHLHYNDAQDMLMFGIYQYPPKELLPVLRRILTHWNREGNIEICSSGTGMTYQMGKVLTKYLAHGIDLVNDTLLPEGARESLAEVQQQRRRMERRGRQAKTPAD